jgi:hypothetical protein
VPEAVRVCRRADALPPAQFLRTSTSRPMANGICGLHEEIEAIAKTPRYDHAA